MAKKKRHDEKLQRLTDQRIKLEAAVARTWARLNRAHKAHEEARRQLKATSKRFLARIVELNAEDDARQAGGSPFTVGG